MNVRAPFFIVQRALPLLRDGGRPEDIADVVAFVASENARWMTGDWIDVTGGSDL